MREHDWWKMVKVYRRFAEFQIFEKNLPNRSKG